MVDGFRIGRIQNEPDLASEANFDLARRWLTTCENEHTDCLKDCSPNLPARVIDVGAKNHDQTLRLVSTRDHSGHYAALSHCWGGKVSPLLLTSNIDHFEDVIRFRDLPPTFQDAVTITRELNIRYLWIDSLCIIQDSKADWEQESKKMGLYYTNSTVTIYASRAESSTCGIFQRDTQPPLAGPNPTCINLFPKPKTGPQIKVQAMDFVDEDLNWLDLYGALASRGWALQESILAPRHLYFGKRQIYWKCHQDIYSADGHPAGCRTPHFTYPSLTTALFSSTLANPTETAGTSDEVLLDYYRLVEAYSSRKLSFASDKLPAFGGLAQRIHSSIGGDYLAGLWSGDLHRGLAWYHEMTTCRHVFIYRAPSWSWAVTDEPILIDGEQFRPDQFKMQLIGHEMSLCDSTNPYGQVKCGYIHVRGFVKSLYRSSQSMSFGRSSHPRSPAYYDDIVEGDGHSPGNTMRTVRVIIDDEDCLMTVSEEDEEDENLKIDSDALLPGKYTVLMIGTHEHREREDLIMASGLILRELGENGGNNFERAGLMPRMELDADWLLEWEERTLKLF